MDSHHYGKRPVCRVSKLLPCTNFRAHGKQTVCRVSSKKHTVNCLPCAQIWGTRQTTPHPTNPPTHTLNRHHLPTSPPSDPPPPLPVSTPAWSPPLPYSPLLPSPPLSCQAGRPLLCLPSPPPTARPSPVVRSSGGARSGGGVLGAPPAGSELQARRELRLELRQQWRTARRELRQ